MIKLLGAFPDTLYVGMNACVGFGKATSAHECAFDVPLKRLLLESNAPLALPTKVQAAQGKGAFCHSGCIPFVAEAIAQQKKTVSAEEVARAASENSVRLYGRGLASRAVQAKAEATFRAEEATRFLAAKAQEASMKIAALKAAEAQAANDNSCENGEGTRKKKKKKKKKRKNRNKDESADEQDNEHRLADRDEAAAADVDLDFF